MARKKIEITREIMLNRIRVAETLRQNYVELVETINTPNLPEKVKKVLIAANDEAFNAMNKAERKVIVAVQKKLGSDFRIACDSFAANSEMWVSDPSVTVIEDSEEEVEEV